MKMSKYIPGCTPEGETAEGKPSDYSDVKIRLNGIPSPEEVKTCDLTGKSIEERNDVFLNAFKRGKDSAIEQIKNDFEKERFKNSEAGIAIIIGFDEE
jgi:endonuclease YncB( thermonuclease family)